MAPRNKYQNKVSNYVIATFAFHEHNVKYIVSQQQNAIAGSLHNIDFGVFWARWVGSGQEPGSGNRFQVQFPEPVLVPDLFRVQKLASARFRLFRCSIGFRDNRLCSQSLDGSGSGNRVPGTRGIKKVPGSGDSVPKVPPVTLYFESILLYFESTLILLYFESLLLKLKIYWRTLKVCTFESILFLYFEKLFLYFESMFLYIESILCTLKICFCTLKV